ncbi:hypothetical protein MKC54_12925 [[Clostridium] innocuum]|nr:hypothetical protein [[Clostridium] innocuum]MCR0577784.1 hypothetical protein [[Clostridium] innocuum]
MKKFTGFLLFGLLLLTLGFGTLTLQSAQNALSIWFEKLVPSMFISMVLVRMLYKEHAFDHLPSFGLPALLGMDKGAWNLVLCTMFLGFPTGSLFVDEAVRDGVLSRHDASRLLYCCCFPTPGFVIISCGIVFFKSLHIGLLLFALQLLSGLLLLLLTRKHTIHTIPTAVASSQSFMRHLSSAITESGISLYMIGGYLMLFTSVTAVLFSFLPELPALIVRSLAEFSSGIVLINITPFSNIQRMLLTSFLLGFAGFCVHMQIMSMVEQVPLRYPVFLLFRILQGLISVALLILCVQFL